MNNTINTMPNDFNSRFYLTFCKNNNLIADRISSIKLYLKYLEEKEENDANNE